MGERRYGGGGRGRVCTYRYTITTRMTCMKMGSDESRFNVSLIVRDNVTRPCPQTTTFDEKGEPKRNRTGVLPLISLPPYRWAKPALKKKYTPLQFTFVANASPRFEWHAVINHSVTRDETHHFSESQLYSKVYNHFFSMNSYWVDHSAWVREEAWQ